MRRVELKSYALPNGTIENVNETLLSGLLPDRIILGLVRSAAANGQLTSTPFDFKSHGLQTISVVMNGESTYQRTLRLDQGVTEAYYDMYNDLAQNSCTEGPDISLTSYSTGKMLFIFNLNEFSDGFVTPRHGNIKIELKFSSPLSESITVICHADYPSVLFVDNNKNAHFKDQQ